MKRFLFTTCQVGAEAPLKAEIARLWPEFKFAYSRPGFVTFKLPAGFEFKKEFQLGSVFASRWGFSLGQNLQEAAAITFVSQGKLDIINVDEKEIWYGMHYTGQLQRQDPKIELPPEAPSRAYLKIEEALIWSRLPVLDGQTAIELGCAPGGASYALLKRGMNVIGVDPGDVDPIVLADPKFKHLRMQSQQVPDAELKGVDWLVSDMNVPPEEVIKIFEKLKRKIGARLQGGILTLKLNDWAMAEKIPGYLEELRAMKFKKVEAAHLSQNRQEVTVVLKS